VIDNGLLVQMILGALLGLSVYLPMAAGQLSLATPAFYAVGGTLAALLSTQGGAQSTIAIATIALVEIVRVAILNLPFTGGAAGIFGIPQPFQQPFGYVLFSGALLAVCGWLFQRLEASRLGRSMAAIRDDELASRCMGIHTTRVKLTAFVASAVLAGITGVIAAHYLNTWNARQGSFDVAITTLAFVILGGSRSWLGPVIGGLLLTALPELLRPVGDLRLVLFGLVILLGPVFFPQGLITPALLERLGRWKP